MVERLVRNEKVRGSTPLGSTILRPQHSGGRRLPRRSRQAKAGVTEDRTGGLRLGQPAMSIFQARAGSRIACWTGRKIAAQVCRAGKMHHIPSFGRDGCHNLNLFFGHDQSSHLGDPLRVLLSAAPARRNLNNGIIELASLVCTTRCRRLLHWTASGDWRGLMGFDVMVMIQDRGADEKQEQIINAEGRLLPG